MPSRTKWPLASVVVAGPATLGDPFTPRVGEKASSHTAAFLSGAPVAALNTRPSTTQRAFSGAAADVCAPRLEHTNRMVAASRRFRMAYTMHSIVQLPDHDCHSQSERAGGTGPGRPGGPDRLLAQAPYSPPRPAQHSRFDRRRHGLRSG